MAKEMINTALGSRNICGSPESSADVQPEYLSICKRLTKYRSSTNIEEINLNINEYVNVICQSLMSPLKSSQSLELLLSAIFVVNCHYTHNR